MRYIILLVVLFSCMEEGLKKDCNSICFKMTISDATPVQFWINGEPTFNESNPICGLTNACFCQPFNCDDEIKIQFQEVAEQLLYIVIFDSNGDELMRDEITEISPGLYEYTFIPENASPPICEKIQILITSKGVTEFETIESPADNSWRSIAYGNGRFVAVASTGTFRVMTSDDSTNWTLRSAALASGWSSVTYGNGLFVAVSQSGLGNRIMTSPDGEIWTSRPYTSAFSGVTYGNGLFVAVGANIIRTSSDGVTWTTQVSPASYNWSSVGYGNGIFVAVSTNGAADGVMTSPDGVTWALQNAANAYSWPSVTFGNGIFVAVSDFTGITDHVMTSPDGVVWTAQTSAADNSWNAVAFGFDIFIAVSSSGTGNRIMSSLDGINWTIHTSPADNSWQSIVYGNGIFVAVSNTGTGDRIMLMDYFLSPLGESDCIDLRNDHQCSKLIEYTNADDFDGIVYDISPQPTFYLRVPAQLLADENPQTQEDLELSNGTIVTIRQTIQEKSIFKLGYMPPYMHTKVQKALMHDTVIIDAMQWKRRDAYEAPRVEDYPLKKGEVLLTKYNSVLKNTI